jgi:hypothetical protein
MVYLFIFLMLSKQWASYCSCYYFEHVDREQLKHARLIGPSDIMGVRHVRNVHVVCSSNVVPDAFGFWVILRLCEGCVLPDRTVFSAPDSSPVPAYLSGQYICGNGNLSFHFMDSDISLESGDSLYLLYQHGNGESDDACLEFCLRYEVSFH